MEVNNMLYQNVLRNKMTYQKAAHLILSRNKKAMYIGEIAKIAFEDELVKSRKPENSLNRKIRSFINTIKKNIRDDIYNNPRLIYDPDKSDFITLPDDTQSKNETKDDDLLADEFGYSPEDIFFKEGKNILRIHFIKERDQNLVRQAKMKWNNESQNDILCYFCKFSFSKKYGEYGRGFIEAHHIIPLSNINNETKFKIEDLIPICSNCHSIIHRSKPFLSVDQLIRIIQ